MNKISREIYKQAMEDKKADIDREYDMYLDNVANKMAGTKTENKNEELIEKLRRLLNGK
jgi:hypothetical protein